MEAESLHREFADRAVAHGGGLQLLRAADAILLVNRAAEAGVPIVAVRGFEIGHEGTRPSTADAADFSAPVAEGHGCWTEAEAFIRACETEGLVFNLDLGPDPLNAA
ncbi:MAG: hypothetical protein ICV87_03960 [Gemmatimonadetes bacterium]|nr:hypothetical protein [Gemmatimonadota bacterium]